MRNPVAQADIEAQIMDASNELEEVTGDLEALADAKSMAKWEYEVAYAQALLAAANQAGSGRNGLTTVDEREAHATIQTQDAYKLHLLEDGKYDARKRHANALEARLSALQTLARVVAPQAGMGR